MAQIVVRDLEDSTVSCLKREASRAGRSLEAEVRRVLDAERDRITRRRGAAEAAAALRAELSGTPQTDSALLRHDGRGV